jgi:hypothetical protein
MPPTSPSVLHRAQRPEIPDLRRRQEAHVDADGTGGRRILVILIHAVVVHREAQVADPGKAHGLTRLFLELVVEIHGVLVDLTDAIAHVE